MNQSAISKPTQDRHLGGLDIVRFSAAMSVLFYHIAALSWAPVGMNYQVLGAPRFEEMAWLSIGWVGVETFFVLSGFVIAQSAENASAFRFLRGRIGRLLPAVILCSTLTLAIILYFHIVPLWTALPNYLRSLFFDPHGPWIDPAYWTLTIEVTFYFLIFLLLALKTFQKIELLCWVLALFSSGYLILRSFFDLRELSQHSLAQHGCFFALGIFLWLNSKTGATLSRALGSLIAAVGGCIEIAFVAHQHLPGYAAVYAPSLWLLTVGAISWSSAAKWAGNQFTRTLGLMTYPVYLIHTTLGSVILRINPWVGRYVALLISIISVLLLSWLIVRLEKPLRRAIESMIDLAALSFRTFSTKRA